MTDPDGIRTVAFYLPQFAPSPENDRWWGKGFTEWTNVASAKPRWEGHRQPRIPGQLGAYDLRAPQTLLAQVDLALAHNISAFCFYHYWSLGHRLLGRFLDRFLASPEPDFPFCLAWGNHTWSRKWDGTSTGLLLEQDYSEADDAEHVTFLLKAFSDPRYLRVDGRPLLVIHHAGGMPDPDRFLKLLSRRCLLALEASAYVLHSEAREEDIRPPGTWRFDGSIDFQPGDYHSMPFIDDSRLAPERLPASATSAFRRNHVVDYTKLEARSRLRLTERPGPPYRHPCVVPDWDNTARRPQDPALVFVGSTPDRYRRWVQSSRELVKERPTQERLIFVNGWNEWGEAAYLEPDTVWGNAYLEAHLP